MSPGLWYDLCLPCGAADAGAGTTPSTSGRHARRIAACLTLGYAVSAAASTCLADDLGAAERLRVAPVGLSACDPGPGDAAAACPPRLHALLTASAGLALCSSSWPGSIGAGIGAQHGTAGALLGHLGRPCEGGEPLTLLSRLAVSAGGPIPVTAWAEAVRGYDVVSVAPTSEAVFQQACSSLDVDIITVDISQPRLPFKLSPQLLAAASKRGVVFELQYAPTLRNQTTRRASVANGTALVRALRGHSLVVSSGADAEAELRSPAEVVHLAAVLWGLSQSQAAAALSSAPAAAVARGADRRRRR
ncbi:hypothetical protein FOA52_015817 [Chlamydomonas sp. UWO 241]|nr:hypothetical protein FOA52_015817 [Chlamydomonas sp. UWO 241]